MGSGTLSVVKTINQACFYGKKICPTCKTKNHGPLCIFPLLRNIKGKQNDFRGYKSKDPSLGHLKMDHRIIGNVRNVQVSPVIKLPMPVMGLSEHLCL